jgi:cytochrome c peroxidase
MRQMIEGYFQDHNLQPTAVAGRAGLMQIALGRDLFFLPSLRNVAAAAPYFHDGSGTILSGSIRQMTQAQLDLKLGNKENSDLVAFLQSLTGSYRGRPLRSPRVKYK